LWPLIRHFIDKAFEESSPFFETPNSLSQKVFLRVMNKLKLEAEEQIEKALQKPHASEDCEFTSSQEFKESLMRHRRMKNDVQMKQVTPLMESQEVC
jgi:hypothetical protein